MDIVLKASMLVIKFEFDVEMTYCNVVEALTLMRHKTSCLRQNMEKRSFLETLKSQQSM